MPNEGSIAVEVVKGIAAVAVAAVAAFGGYQAGSKKPAIEQPAGHEVDGGTQTLPAGSVDPEETVEQLSKQNTELKGKTVPTKRRWPA